MPSVLFDFDRAQRNVHNRVVLDIDGGPLVYGFVMDDFAYTLGNQFETMYQGIGGTNDLAQMATLVANKAMQAKQFILRNLNQTVSQWTGSERLAFSLNLMFVAIEPGDDVMAPVQILQQLALPAQAGAPAFTGEVGKQVTAFVNSALGGLVLNAPNGYGGTNSDVHGAVGISIGQWWQTPKWFLVKSMNPTFSRARLRSGKPLYSIVGITFEAYRLLLASEVNGFLVDVQISDSAFVSYTGNPTGSFSGRMGS